MNFMKKQILTGLATGTLMLAFVSGIVNNLSFGSGADVGSLTSTGAAAFTTTPAALRILRSTTRG